MQIDVHDMFERIVPTYDLLNHLFSFNVDKLWRKLLVKTACLPENGRVLDVCTGTGDVAIAFAKYAPTSRIVGVDFSEKMLERGREKITSAGFPERIELEVGDATALEFPDDSFDAVSVAFGLRNLGDRKKGIYEMTRTAKRGGRVLILEFVPPRPTFFGKLYGWYLRHIMPPIGGVISGFRPSYTYLYASIAEFMQPEDIVATMEKSGLTECTGHRLTGGIAYLFHGVKA